MIHIKKYTSILLGLFLLSLSSFVFGENRDNKVVEPQILVIFGATGDLAQKKLFPALNELHLKNDLPDHYACIGMGRTEFTDAQFRQNVFNQSKSTISDKIFYVRTNFNNDSDYEKLKDSIIDLENRLQTKGNRVFYLATAASYFPTIIQKLKEHELIYDVSKEDNKWSRVIIEKPLGNDYNSALKLRDLIVKNLDESQIYLIDHYLGKEVIQNLLTFRFLNPPFESLWNHEHIESVQVILSEDIGIGDRGKFWEETGLLRDLVQNHVMQIISLVAMERPLTLSSVDIHHEKIKLLNAVRPFSINNLDSHIIRGQYGPGIIQGKSVKGYREEKNVSPDSNVETYVAAQLAIDTPRWEGVPFFIVAGKRLKEKLTEIVINFKQSDPAPHNALIFRIQPNEEIAFVFNSKIPDIEGTVEQEKMTFNYMSKFQKTIPDAYERLLYQCMLGDKRLFVSFEESLISWKIYTPVLEFWKSHAPIHFPNYPAGSDGPHLFSNKPNNTNLKEFK